MVRAVLVAVIVACSLVVAAIGPAPALQSPALAQIDGDRPADVEMLGLDSPAGSAVTTRGVDVSTAVAIQRDAARSAIDRRALEVAFERADDDGTRRELLSGAATDVEIAASELRAETREARAGYLDGAVDSGAIVRSRARAAAKAQQLRADLEVIGRFAEQVPQLSIRSRLEVLQVSLTGADGPVSHRMRASIAGEGPPITAYVAASSNGRALAMVDGGQYVREVYRSDLWTPDTTTGIGFDEAVARTSELYPVAFNSSRNIGRGMGEHGAGTYRISMEVLEGNVVTYLDGGTRDVFFEVQRFRLDSIEPGPPASASDNGTRLVVNRTHDGGPLRVAAFDNATGAASDVPVVIGETRYRTGPDGVVWAVDPAGPTTVLVEGDAGTVSVTVRPLSPSLVDVSGSGG